eukprot:GHVU01026767.1.p1 GENE.GHVU01026767.1~~GHVU01026767.1.p1  ORF type:complete len:135 (+),score=7.40 GHVU01026767.1:388-792(+)
MASSMLRLIIFLASLVVFHHVHGDVMQYLYTNKDVNINLGSKIQKEMFAKKEFVFLEETIIIHMHCFWRVKIGTQGFYIQCLLKLKSCVSQRWVTKFFRHRKLVGNLFLTKFIINNISGNMLLVGNSNYNYMYA